MMIFLNCFLHDTPDLTSKTISSTIKLDKNTKL